MRRSAFPRLGTYSSSTSSYPNLSRRGSMRAISRPRKTDAIATHRPHKQKWAREAHSKKPRLKPEEHGFRHACRPTPARGRTGSQPKKQKALGGLFLLNISRSAERPEPSGNPHVPPVIYRWRPAGAAHSSGPNRVRRG